MYKNTLLTSRKSNWKLKKQFHPLFFVSLLLTLSPNIFGQEFNMPPVGTLEITDCTGTIYDSGGPDGNYYNNESGVLIIDPPGDSRILITFIYFDLEDSGVGCFDELLIYDGAGINAPLFPNTPPSGWCWDLDYSNGTGNLNGQSFLSSGDALTLQLISDENATRPGFEIVFDCVDVPPIPSLGLSTDISCDGVVEFSNTGEVFDVWDVEYNWDFGDGSTSNESNPIHTYTTEGTYDVSLELCNQYGCTDTTFFQAVLFDSQMPICFELTMPTYDSEVFTGCSLTLFDSGGPNEPVVSNNDASYTIVSDEPNTIVTLSFNEFSLSEGDIMTIYDGYNTDGSILALYDNTGFPEDSITTTGEAVTIQFQKSNSLDTNYEIFINCLNTETAPEPFIETDNIISCDGNVNFFNVGIEANSWNMEYFWDFGDGITSTEVSPIHAYEIEDIYYVTLEVCNQFGCGETASTIAVTFDSQDPSCFEFNMPAFDTQIINLCGVTLYDSGGPNEPAMLNNEALSIIAPDDDNILLSLEFIELEFGDFGDVMTIYDGPDSTAPIIAVFNGINNSSEPIVSSGNAVTIQFQEFATPNSNYEIFINCISVNSQPTAAFQTNQPLFTCDGNVQFLDFSSNSPTSWTWDFGDGNISTNQNPFHHYTAPGHYEVTLTACNDFGCDEMSINYVYLLSNDPICDGQFMVPNTELNIAECTGVLHDSGGPNNDYLTNEESIVVLGNSEAEGISLTFTEFNIGSNFDSDVLNIYAGSNTNAPLIGSYNGNVLPNLGRIIHSETSYITLELISGYYNTGSGFTAYWNVQGGSASPIAAFGAESFAPAYGVPFQFTDLTSESPSSWFWEFGDGNNSFEQNPTHVYFNAGANIVMLEASNCVSTDEALPFVVFVQEPPFLLTDIDNSSTGWEIDIESGQILDTIFTINNLYGGDLHYEISIPDTLEWLNINSPQGIVEPLSVIEITFTFDASILLDGIYLTALLIETNDPALESFYVPITLNVEGTPVFGVDTSNIDFEDIIQFSSETQTLTITNTGTDSLFITDIIFPSDDYEANISEFGLFPMTTQEVVITFTPSLVEIIENAVILIQTNVGEFEILVSADVAAAPIATASPIPLQITVDYMGTATAELNLTNSGLESLEYEIVNPLSLPNGFVLEFTTSGNTSAGFTWHFLDSNNNIVAEAPNAYTEEFTTYTETFTAFNPCEEYRMVIDDSSWGSITGWTVTELLTGNEIDDGSGWIYHSDTIALGSLYHEWINHDVNDGILLPNEEQIITIEVNPGCFLGGGYHATILINSNDPVNPIIPVYVYMIVVGTPEIEFENYTSGDTLFFDKTTIGLTSTNELTVANNGTDNLFINYLLFENNLFSIEQTPPPFVLLKPGNEFNFVITFAPDQVVEDTSTLTLVTNIGDYEFILNATSQAAPATEINPAELVINVLKDSTTYETLDLFNFGEGNLEYTLEIEGAKTGFIFEFETDTHPEDFSWQLSDSQDNLVGGMSLDTYTQPNNIITEMVSGLNADKTYTLLIGDDNDGCEPYSIYDLATGDLVQEGEGVEVASPFIYCEYITDIGSPIYDSLLTINSDSGIVEPSGNKTLDLIFDATGLSEGIYEYVLILFTNDSANLKIEIPFIINVLDFVTGLEEIPNTQLTIAPNPNNGLLSYQLKMKQASDLQLHITNAFGEIVYEDYLTNQANYQEQIDLTNYPNGLYVIRFTNNQQQFTKSFILQH